MSTSPAARRLRSLLALAVLAGVAVGIPLVLVRVADWPLPTRMPDWDRVRLAIRQNDIPAAVVIKTLACVVWIAWAQMMWALAWELAVNIRTTGDGGGQPARTAPLVPTAMSIGMGRLVAAILAIGLTVSSPAARALNRPATAAAVVIDPAPAAQAAPRAVAWNGAPVVSVASVRSQWCVADDDTLWDIADLALGDGSRAGEILELNASLATALDVQRGQVLVMPADARIPDDRKPTRGPVEAIGDGGGHGPSATLVIETPGYLPAETITIRRGDNLWHLSEHRLDRVDTDVTGPEILDYLDEVIAANRDIVEDPNLIYPGERFTFPAIGDPPPADAAPPATPEPPIPAASAPDTTVEPAEPSSSVVPTTTAAPTTTSAPTSSTVPVTTVAPMPTSAAPVTVPATSVATSVPRVVPAPTVLRRAAETDQRAPLFASLASAGVLASGLALHFRRRRRMAEAATTGRRRARIRRRAAEIEQALVRAGDLSLVRWAHQELGQLCELLDPTRFTAVPVAVEISTEHGLEILWDQQTLNPPRPWDAENDGWTWRMLYDPDHHLQPRPGPVPIPGLVSVGTRDGNTLLFNLEAIGTLAITGDPTRVRAYATALVTELATNDDLANTWIHVAGPAIPGADQLERIKLTDAATAIGHARAATVDHEALISDKIPNAFALRLGGDAHGRDIAVAILDSAATIDAPIAPNRGAACVILGASNHAAQTLRLMGDTHAVLEPLGLTFTPHDVDIADLAAVAEATDELFALVDDPSDDEADDDIDCQQREVSSIAIDPDVDDGDEDDWSPPTPTHLVRVFGKPSIDGFPKAGRLETSIAVFLACRGGHATIEQIIDAVWDGQAIDKDTAYNRLSKARSALRGVVASRVHGDPEARLEPGVLTDLDLVEALVARSDKVSGSEASALLQSALAYVCGMPFDAGGYDWAHTGQHHKRAVDTIEDLVLRIVDHAVDSGDIACARDALRRGQQALPGYESLYRSRMNVESAAGNLADVTKAYNELVGYLRTLTGSDNGEVSPATQRLFDRLTGRAAM